MSYNDEETILAKFTLRLVGDVLGTIAVPVVALSIIGRWLDARIGTRPFALAASILCAFLVSSVSICQKAIRYRREYELLTEMPPPDNVNARPPPIVDGEGRDYSSALRSCETSKCHS